MKNNNQDFRSFLSLLEAEGELVRAKRDVDPKYEISGVTAKLDGRQAVLFEKVLRSKISVACNVCGTPKRFYFAISGTRKKAVQTGDVKKAIHAHITEALGSQSEPAKAQGPAPFEKNSSKSLLDLPVVTHFEKDAGPFVTSSIVFAKDQEKGNQNSSTHRLLRLDDRYMAIRMVEGRHL